MRRFVVFVVVSTLCVVAPVGSARAAATPLPDDATILVPGHGWGHGRGMGQWGAKGMADAGSTWSQIVNHYYSDVTLGSRAAETIRVLVETSSDTVMTSDAPFTIAWSTGTTVATSDGTYPYWRAIYSGSSHIVQKSTAYNGPWSTVASSSSYVVFKPGSQMLQLIFNAGTVRYYRGTMIARHASDGMRSMNELTMEQYLQGSVPRESPASWPAEALKAQAVAARSYAAYKKVHARAAGSWFDICATTSCQVYLGAASKPSVNGTKTVLESSSTNAAIAATAGRVLLYNGAPILAEYSSSTGGYTAPGSVAYQKAVPDPADSVSPYHDWTGTLSVSDVEAAWPSIGRLVDLTVTDRYGAGEWGGRVSRIDIVGTSATVSVSGGTFSSVFASKGVRGNWFTPVYWRGEIVSAPSTVTALAGDDTTVVVRVKNTGTASWPIGGSVRMATPGASQFYDSSWISTTRVASVSRNISTGSSANVGPGQTGEFRLPLSVADHAPGLYGQRFSLVADGGSTTDATFNLRVQVLDAWTDEAPNMLTAGSFESPSDAWKGASLTAGDGPTTAAARDGVRSFLLSGNRAKNLTQTIELGGGFGRRFVVAGWNRSDATSASKGSIALIARAVHADGSSTYARVYFPKASHPWTYGEATLDASSTSPVRSVSVTAIVMAQSGSVNFDAVRLIETPVANWSFERGLSGWNTGNFASGDGTTTTEKRDGASSLALTGDPDLKQAIALGAFHAARSERFVFSAWNKAVGSAGSGGSIAGVITLHHPDGSSTDTRLEFPRDPHDWTYGQVVVTATAPVDFAVVHATSADQTGTTYFDDMRLIRSWNENPSFEEDLSPWMPYGFSGADGLSSAAVAGGASALALTGSGRRGVRQYIRRAGGPGSRIAVSGWVRQDGTSATGGPVGILAGFVNTDGTTSYTMLPFDRGDSDWTYRESVVTATKRFTQVVLYAVFHDQTGSAWFDGITSRNV